MYPLAYFSGLRFAARRMIRDVNAYLENVRDRQPISLDSGTKHRLGILRNPHIHIRLMIGILNRRSS
jgi:hypothetical protein